MTSTFLHRGSSGSSAGSEGTQHLDNFRNLHRLLAGTLHRVCVTQWCENKQQQHSSGRSMQSWFGASSMARKRIISINLVSHRETLCLGCRRPTARVMMALTGGGGILMVSCRLDVSMVVSSVFYCVLKMQKKPRYDVAQWGKMEKGG